jgi:hypothetical protein
MVMVDSKNKKARESGLGLVRNAALWIDQSLKPSVDLAPVFRLDV